MYMMKRVRFFYGVTNVILVVYVHRTLGPTEHRGNARYRHARFGGHVSIVAMRPIHIWRMYL